MKKIFLFAICIALLSGIAYSSAASVVISQVLYNPLATESGGEAVEIYNNGNEDAEISGWVIATEATMQDAVIPENTIICAGCYYLIADSGWNSSKDNSSWPDADLEEPLNLYNTDSGIALIENGTIVDAVGWGNADAITAGLFEEVPASHASEGNSLLRVKDTGSNIDDFAESCPFFRSSADIGTGTYPADINVDFELNNASNMSTVSQILIDFLNISEGTKISPIPGGVREITVNALISGNDIGNVTATLSGTTISLSKTEEVNSTASVFSGKFGLDYFMPPGNYNINVEASSGSSKESAKISFEYLELVAIEAGAPSISFGEIDAGKEYYSEIKIRNIGNTVIDIGIGCTGFNSTKYSIDSASTYYSIGNSSFSRMSSNTIIKDVGLAYGEGSETSLKIRITAPQTAESGKYTGIIEITAVGSND